MASRRCRDTIRGNADYTITSWPPEYQSRLSEWPHDDTDEAYRSYIQTGKVDPEWYTYWSCSYALDESFEEYVWELYDYREDQALQEWVDAYY